MVRLTLKQCTYFVAVAEYGGIAQASRALNITQPAVAQAIEKIEHLFELHLFERHHARGTELTPQGRAFLSSAEKLIEQAQITEQNARVIAADDAGIIRFGCFHTIAPYYLPQIVSAYKAAFSGVEVAPVELRQDEITDGLNKGEIDLALTYDMSLARDKIDYQVLLKLQTHLLVSEAHPMARKKSVTLADFATEPYIMFEGPSSSEYFENIFSAHGISPPIIYRSKSMESVRSAVANGLGFSLGVMQPKYEACADRNKVVCLSIRDYIEPIAIVLARRKAAPKSRQVARLTAFCNQYFQQQQ